APAGAGWNGVGRGGRGHSVRRPLLESGGTGGENVELDSAAGFAALDQLADPLPALAADLFVELLPVPGGRGAPAAAADRGVVVGAVLLLRRAAALAANLAVEVRTIASLDGLAALPAGLGDRHLLGLVLRHSGIPP